MRAPPSNAFATGPTAWLPAGTNSGEAAGPRRAFSVKLSSAAVYPLHHAFAWEEIGRGGMSRSGATCNRLRRVSSPASRASWGRGLGTRLFRLRLLFQRALDGGALGHPAAVVGDAREDARVDAVSLEPIGEREEIGVGDRIVFAHDPGAAEHLALDEVETCANRLRDLAPHGLVGLRIVGPAAAPHPVRVRDMHGRAEIGV